MSLSLSIKKLKLVPRWRWWQWEGRGSIPWESSGSRRCAASWRAEGFRSRPYARPVIRMPSWSKSMVLNITTTIQQEQQQQQLLQCRQQHFHHRLDMTITVTITMNTTDDNHLCPLIGMTISKPSPWQWPVLSCRHHSAWQSREEVRASPHHQDRALRSVQLCERRGTPTCLQVGIENDENNDDQQQQQQQKQT